MKRNRVQVFPSGESRTEQSHARSCDINTIMAKYAKTGVITHVSKYQPVYGDVSAADFQAAANLVAEVKTEFEELPAFVRAKFDSVEDYLALMKTNEGVEELRSIVHPAERYNRDGSPAPEGSQEASSADTPPEGASEAKPAEDQ